MRCLARSSTSPSAPPSPPAISLQSRSLTRTQPPPLPHSEAWEAFEHTAAACARFVRDPIHPSIPSSPTGVPFSEHGAAAPLLLMRSCCPPVAARIGVGDLEHGHLRRRASCPHFDVRRSGSGGNRAMRKWISKIRPEPPCATYRSRRPPTPSLGCDPGAAALLDRAASIKVGAPRLAGSASAVDWTSPGCGMAFQVSELSSTLAQMLSTNTKPNY